MIKFCNFSPPAWVNTHNLSSQRCIWVQTGPSTAWGLLHSAATNFCWRQSGYYLEQKWNFLVIQGGGLRRPLIFSAQRPVLLNRHRRGQRGAPEKSPARPSAKIPTLIDGEFGRKRGCWTVEEIAPGPQGGRVAALMNDRQRLRSPCAPSPPTCLTSCSSSNKPWCRLVVPIAWMRRLRLRAVKELGRATQLLSSRARV